MTCTPINLGDGVTAIVCTRGGARERAKCDFCGNVHALLCDFPLKGAKAGKTCSKRICKRCGTHVARERDLCPPHAKVVRDARVPQSVLDDPDPSALTVVLDIALEHGSLEHDEGVDPDPPPNPNQADLFTGMPEPPAPSPIPTGNGLPKKWHDRADWNEYIVERAAIFEYLAEMPREAAEQAARELVGAAPRK